MGLKAWGGEDVVVSCSDGSHFSCRRSKGGHMSGKLIRCYRGGRWAGLCVPVIRDDDIGALCLTTMHP